jgi:hypothetical protein
MFWYMLEVGKIQSAINSYILYELGFWYGKPPTFRSIKPLTFYFLIIHKYPFGERLTSLPLVELLRT